MCAATIILTGSKRGFVSQRGIDEREQRSIGTNLGFLIRRRIKLTYVAMVAATYNLLGRPNLPDKFHAQIGSPELTSLNVG